MKRLMMIILGCLCLTGSLHSQDREITVIAHMLGNITLYDGYSMPIWGFIYPTDLSADQLPGPTLDFNEGDSVHLILDNGSSMPHTIHLHGMDVGQADDGVPSTSFQVEAYRDGTYHFRAHDPGTYLYHCHVETVIHLQMGMYGAVIVRPDDNPMSVYGPGSEFSKEYLWLGGEADTTWHTEEFVNGEQPRTYRPQYFLINGKSHQQITEDQNIRYEAQQGDTVLLRLANMGYGIHRYILPASLKARVMGSDGRQFETAIQQDTIDVYPGERYAVLTYPDQILTDSVRVEYLSNYKKQVWGVNYIPVTITERQDPLGIDDSQEPNLLFQEGSVHFSFPTWAPRQVTLYDLNGQLIRKESFRAPSIKFGIPENLQGLYIIKVDSHNTTLSYKLFLK